MICDTRMLKNRLLQFASQLHRSAIRRGTIFSCFTKIVKKRRQREQENEEIKLIFLSRFLSKRTKRRIENALGFRFDC